MRNRHFLPGLLLATAFLLGSCSVYTVHQPHFEKSLKQRTHKAKGLSLNAVSFIKKGKNHNNLDTLFCVDKQGRLKPRKLSYDSRITIVTRNNITVTYFVKTLYIWKDEFLIGERSGMSLVGPNYFPVRLADISRIEMKGI